MHIIYYCSMTIMCLLARNNVVEMKSEMYVM